MTNVELLQAIAADMDAEYARLERLRLGEETAVFGRLQGLARWAAHLRAVAANGGEYREIVGGEARRPWTRDVRALAARLDAECTVRHWALTLVEALGPYAVEISFRNEDGTLYRFRALVPMAARYQENKKLDDDLFASAVEGFDVKRALMVAEKAKAKS